jgi:hypothetical protein
LLRLLLRLLRLRSLLLVLQLLLEERELLKNLLQLKGLGLELLLLLLVHLWRKFHVLHLMLDLLQLRLHLGQGRRPGGTLLLGALMVRMLAVAMMMMMLLLLMMMVMRMMRLARILLLLLPVRTAVTLP